MNKKSALKLKKIFLMGFLFLYVHSIQAYAEEIVRLATTTSTYETGLLDYILPPFEQKNDLKVHVISVGTGKAIKLGENGDVDVILVHARAAEENFVVGGYGVNRRGVMYNDFVILGPKDDPAEIKISNDATKALSKIFQTKSTFVSRGDNSGTHKKEQGLWAKAGLSPSGGWYLESGQGMSATLRMADEKEAYVLVDRATYLFNKDHLRVEKLFEGHSDLFNPYGIIAVSPYKHKHVKYDLAMDLIAWITSPECQDMISKYKKSGNFLFIANAAESL